MRRTSGIAALSAVVALALTACGGSSASDTLNNAISNASKAASVAASAASANAGETAPANAGSVDCSGITKDDLAKFLVYTQVMAQATSADTVAAIKAKQISDYTPAAMSAILAKLGVLAGHPAPGFADPADSLAYFAKANDLLAAMIAADSPSQAQLDEYAAATGGTASAIGKQAQINASIAQYCKI
jgi:hypothetical protein